jgi:peptidyl-prolyl cis-trans isomerase SurA
MSFMKYQTLVSLLIVSCQLCFSPAQAAPRTLSTRGDSLDRIVAVVDEGVILNSELNAEIDRIKLRLKQQNTELPSDSVLRTQVLDRLIQQELQLQRAAKGGLKVTDDMLNNALNDVASSSNVKFSDLPALIEAQGLSYAVYREELRRDIALQVMQREIVSGITITPRELDQALAKQARTPDANAQYNLSHILIAVASNATPAQLAEREARADLVVTKANAEQNFAELAVTYSDSSTNVDGGSLGWRSGAQLPSIIAERIPNLKVGELTEIIRTPSGFHIFKLNDKRGGEVEQQLQSQVHGRHILLKTTEVEDDNTVQQRLEKIRARILDLGWAGPGTFVGEFEKTLDKLNENEISAPFKSQFGWHIVQLLGRRTQDISEETRRNKAYVALRESRAEEEIELWVRSLRANAYVETLL